MDAVDWMAVVVVALDVLHAVDGVGVPHVDIGGETVYNCGICGATSAPGNQDAQARRPPDHPEVADGEGG